MGTHFACAFIASAAGALAGNPMDVIKSRTIVQNRCNTEGALAPSQSYLSLTKEIYRQEGSRAFLKGLDALAIRLGCFHCVMFVVLEQIKVAMYCENDCDQY
mmetsp:Transcript_14185/g.16904  ORF Transcript_14185/g.16904 Transcript_14185/m.16904 type:complete len:102 (-) Transcript_14185:55-360(-)